MFGLRFKNILVLIFLSGLAEGEKLKATRQFYDERWSRHRTVTCMDWSTQYPELLVASYNNNEDAPHEPDGVTLIWNTKYKKDTPEYVFHCQVGDHHILTVCPEPQGSSYIMSQTSRFVLHRDATLPLFKGIPIFSTPA